MRTKSTITTPFYVALPNAQRNAIVDLRWFDTLEEVTPFLKDGYDLLGNIALHGVAMQNGTYVLQTIGGVMPLATNNGGGVTVAATPVIGVRRGRKPGRRPGKRVATTTTQTESQ